MSTPLPTSPDDVKKTKFLPIHSLRLRHHNLESTLRKEWENYLNIRPGFDILCGPEVRYIELPPGVKYDENKLTGGYQAYPYGRMTARDHMVASELIQWLGSPVGFAFLSTAFAKADKGDKRLLGLKA